MTTRATATLQGLADQWEHLFGSAVFSGIVGDTAHAARGGYHISIQDQSDPQNYSIVRPDDKAPPGDWPRDCAAAIDMNLTLADMKLCHARLVAVWKTRTLDPRAKYINGHNGWNGTGNAGRYDWVTGNIGAASDDHKWHVHLEVRRRYVNDPVAASAIVSILAGDTATEWRHMLMRDLEWQHVDAVLPILKFGDSDGQFGNSDTRWVMRVQRLLGVTVDGDYGPVTAAAIAGLQIPGHTDGKTCDLPVWERLAGLWGAADKLGAG